MARDNPAVSNVFSDLSSRHGSALGPLPLGRPVPAQRDVGGHAEGGQSSTAVAVARSASRQRRHGDGGRSGPDEEEGEPTASDLLRQPRGDVQRGLIRPPERLPGLHRVRVQQIEVQQREQRRRRQRRERQEWRRGAERRRQGERVQGGGRAHRQDGVHVEGATTRLMMTVVGQVKFEFDDQARDFEQATRMTRSRITSTSTSLTSRRTSVT